MILVIIPFVWIYAFYRIEKLRIGIGLAIVVIVADIGVQMLLPFPYGLIASYVIAIGVPTYFIRKRFIEWNKKFID